jgi:hypothetical protein
VARQGPSGEWPKAERLAAAGNQSDHERDDQERTGAHQPLTSDRSVRGSRTTEITRGECSVGLGQHQRGKTLDGEPGAGDFNGRSEALIECQVPVEHPRDLALAGIAPRAREHHGQQNERRH